MGAQIVAQALLFANLVVAPAVPIAAAAPPEPRQMSGASALSNPGPTAAPSDQLKPLREIGRVRATTVFCKTIIDHATLAARLGIDNDGKIDGIVRTLRTADLDTSALSKNRALQELNNQYAPLAEQSIAAEHAAKALREDAKGASNADQAKALLAFADALDGALHRQRTIARDLASMIAIFNARPLMTRMEHEDLMVEAQLADTVRGSVTYDNPQNQVPPLLSSVAADSADQIV